MDLAPVIAQLASELSGFKKIGGAADLDAAFRSNVAAPACYVLPMAESAEESTLVGAIDQRVTVDFSVVLVLSNRQDAAGAAAVAGLESYRNQVKEALLGWVVEPAINEPVQFSGGRLLRFDDGLLWWADEFRVRTYIRSV